MPPLGKKSNTSRGNPKTTSHKGKWSSRLRAVVNKLKKKSGAMRTGTGTMTSNQAWNLGIRGSFPFPNKRMAVLDYVDQIALTSSAAGLFGTEQVYRLNSLYDPDFTGTGHQPYGYDQLAALYLRYKVEAVKIFVEWGDVSGDGIFPAFMVTTPNDGTTLAGKDVPTACEKQNVYQAGPISNTGQQLVRQALYLPMHKAVGLTKLQFAADVTNYGAAVGANPTLSPFIRFAIADTAVTGGLSVKATIRIRYYTLWEGLTTQAQS